MLAALASGEWTRVLPSCSLAAHLAKQVERLCRVILEVYASCLLCQCHLFLSFPSLSLTVSPCLSLPSSPLHRS
jgi:hypothetical protein